MVLDNLGSSLRAVMQKVAKSSWIDEAFIEEIVRDIQRALIMSDVDIKLVLSLTTSIKEKALEKPPAGTLSKREHIINVLYEELVTFLGTSPDINLRHRPMRIMLLGLFGSGKTTTCSKLALYFKKKGLASCIIGTDTWRPAAYEQLAQLGKKIDVPVFGDPKADDPVRILNEGLEHFSDKYDVIIVDTAGRDGLDSALISEVKALNIKFKPHEVLLVLSGDIGQGARTQAQAFHENVGVTGVVITKLDGTAKGGGALSACSVTDAPVKFIGTGEMPQDLELFDPAKFVSRLLGMGDISTLLEKAKEAVEETELDPEAFMKGDYTLVEFYDQLEAARSMGPLKQVFELLGMGGAQLPDELLSASEEKLEKYRFILDSMTVDELREPKRLNRSRMERVAQGSGTKVEEIKELVNHFNQSKKLIKMMKKRRFRGDMSRVMKQLGGGGFPGLG
ncbi:MAG: signal recognition particle protein Srp54 [Methanopyri archaeon]|nr:signal recognition particle protein Srp54 [Methanopyri archaeon]